MNEGKPAGQVVAGFGVDCGSIHDGETLTVTGRLLKLSPSTGRWHVEQTRTAHWTDLTKTRNIDLREPCAHAVFKASFSGVLRYPGGKVAGTVSAASARLQVVVPCSFG